jgi:GNAT superfamily N-acetyltransferase
MRRITIAPLGPEHEREGFDCGQDSVTRYLRQIAMQAQKAYRSATKVAIHPDRPKRILGFYTLVNHRIIDHAMPEWIAKKLKITNLREGAPAILLAQVGVDLAQQRRGLGKFLLQRALRECHEVAKRVGGVAVLVDALDQRGARWYEEIAQFSALEENGLRLILPMKTLELALAAAAPKARPLRRATRTRVCPHCRKSPEPERARKRYCQVCGVRLVDAGDLSFLSKPESQVGRSGPAALPRN